MLDAGARSALAGTRFGDVRWFDEVDSTNRYLLDQARAGAPEGVVAVADHQSAGRGRLGRTWVAPPGASLLMSVLLRPLLPPERLHLVNVATALSAADACRSAAGVDPELKWPNDLVVGPRKLAGVLAEADHSTRGHPAVVVGVGLNVNWPEELPAELVDIATSLNRLCGHDVDRSQILVALLEALEGRCGALGSAAGIARIGTEYRQRCTTLGSEVRVQLPDETFTGRALDITDDGHLMVDVGMCMRAVTAGDVVHVRRV
ncbi:MAG TPA: biotin--[acetyl-CoA-carboxylase] ligase [Acidimicrobiales bacterium]|nr:biotin--[acetyl-CoA-carboxylase] ligase [Acidimicrobiales bacterium]